jgi:valyl-tRNA synthetase
MALAGLAQLTIGKELPSPPLAATAAVMFPDGHMGQVYINLAGIIDLDKETARIHKRLNELTTQMEQTQKKLSNPEFVAKVPPEVLEKTRAKHQEFLLERDKLDTQLKRLQPGAAT